MKVSFRWLREIAPGLQGSPDELAKRLAALGAPVESIERLAEGLEDIVVARVREVRAHPNADRLRVCEVDDGSGVRSVVCGAPNVVAGGVYPFAPVGATLPGGTTIGRAKLRGEVSEGMLCSERELGLGHGAQGLMTLSEGLAPGIRLVEALALDDSRLDVEVTSNRPDLLSHEGIARELAPGGHASLVLPGFPGEESAAVAAVESLELRRDSREASSGRTSVRIEAPELCARYLGLVVRGVRVGPSPPWLQNRLRAAGARPINNVVDATNFVLLELGQPLHAFDLDRLEGHSVVVREARAGETLRTLDGVSRVLVPGMLAICDSARPAAVAGVMGGADSEVTDATRDLLLECAHFTPGPIRATRKALGMTTDASYRFERGVDPEGMARAMHRVARLIVATAGGTLEGPILDCAPRPFSRATVSLRPARVERLLGVPVRSAEIRSLLEPLGFDIEERSGALAVQVPGFRSFDVKREVDLVEEIARRKGFDAFPEALRPFRPSAVPDHPLFALEDRLRDRLVGLGLREAQTPAFAPASEGEVELVNPISAEEGFLRTSLVPGLVRRLEHNLARGVRDVRLFEIGTVFRRGGRGELPVEETRVAAVLHGDRRPPHWSDAGGSPLDLWDLKGVLARVAETAHGSDVEVGPVASAPEVDSIRYVAPEAALAARDRGGRALGVGGRLVAGGADLPPWASEVWIVEVALPAAPAPESPPSYLPLPSHPGVERDLALLVPAGVSVGALLGFVRGRGGEWLRDIGVFDVYRDDKMGAGERSVAIRLQFRAHDRTLTDAEVEEAVRRIVHDLGEELHVGVRGSQG
jgi:phenylalanyl-tRNA synthetase beta chain